jgi:hypothetical protein
MRSSVRNVSEEGLLRFIDFYEGVLKSRRYAVKRLSLYDTPDSRRLAYKLQCFDMGRILERSYEIGGFVKDRTASVSRYELLDTKRDLAWDLYTVDSKGVRELRQDVETTLSEYEFKRLDWLWDFAWTYWLNKREKTTTRALEIYTLVRGPIPVAISSFTGERRGVSFQLVLSAERKRRLRKWERAYYSAWKKQDQTQMTTLLRADEATCLLKQQTKRD